MVTRLRYPGGEGWIDETRRATYVFCKEPDGQWRCTVDNSYGTTLLGRNSPAIGLQPTSTVTLARRRQSACIACVIKAHHQGRAARSASQIE